MDRKHAFIRLQIERLAWPASGKKKKGKEKKKQLKIQGSSVQTYLAFIVRGKLILLKFCQSTSLKHFQASGALKVSRSPCSHPTPSVPHAPQHVATPQTPTALPSMANLLRRARSSPEGHIPNPPNPQLQHWALEGAAAPGPSASWSPPV